MLLDVCKEMCSKSADKAPCDMCNKVKIVYACWEDSGVIETHLCGDCIMKAEEIRFVEGE